MGPTSQPAAPDQLSLERFVVFELDAEEYAVPILTVTEVVPYTEIIPVPGAPAYILGLINLRGKVVPVIDLEKRFSLPRSNAARPGHIMIAESEQKLLFGIVVDYVREVLKVPHDVLKPAPEAIKSSIAAEYISGIIVLGEDDDTQAGPPAAERMLLVLDLQKILSDANVEELRVAQASPPPIPAPAVSNATNEGDSL
jgi:purine-binding chemotaxis protein CheW